MYGTQGHHGFYPPPGHQLGGPGYGPGFATAPPKPVGVFWDIENCPLPKGTAASSVIHFIRNSFVVNRLNHREYEFLIACDVSRLRRDIPEDINKSGGVTLAHVSGNSKNAADEKLRESMKRFVDTHSSLTPMLILISGDIDFVNDLRGFQTRLGCTIVVLHGPTASQHFKIGWNEVYPFQDYLMRMPAASLEPTAPVYNMTPGGAKKMEESGIGQSMGQRSPQTFAPHTNFPGVRGPNPGQGAPPVVKSQRNAAKFPAAVGLGGFNSGVPEQQQQQQHGAGNPDGEPLSNRAKKRAMKFAANGIGPMAHPNVGGPAAFVGSLGSSNQPQQAQNTTAYGVALRGGSQNANIGATLQNGPNGSEGIGQSKRAQNKANKKLTENGGEAPNTGAAGKKNRQKSGPFDGPNIPQPGHQKKKEQGGPAPFPRMPGPPEGANGPKPPKEQTILMVSGLPGKMDFRIMKEHLQSYASTVSGKVMYVHNGQGFITFKRKEDADKAIQLFQGREIYGKKLNIQLSKSIPFQNVRPEGAAGFASGNGARGQNVGSDFVVVDRQLPPPQPQPSASSSNNNPNNTLLAEGFAAFAAAALQELSLKQGGSQGNQGGQKGNKKQKPQEDPNCVIQ